MASIYDFPDLYELVLERNPGTVETEVGSIRRLLVRDGINNGRVLELACGACAHGILLAQQGFSVVGLDLSEAMLGAARSRADAAGVDLRAIRGDVVDFALDERPFDAAIFMFETFPVISEYDDLVRHFGSVRRHLRPGGLYIIDVDAWGHGIGNESGEWGRRTIQLPDGSIEIWNEDFPGDWVQGTIHLVLHCRIARGGAVQETVDDWRIRKYSPWMISLLVRTLQGWSLDGIYSWRDLATEVANEDHYFVVLRAA